MNVRGCDGRERYREAYLNSVMGPAADFPPVSALRRLADVRLPAGRQAGRRPSTLRHPF